MNGKKLGLWATLSGIGAAVIASLCCAGPVILAALGVSGALGVLNFSVYRPLFLTLATLLLFVAVFLLVKKKEVCCEINPGKARLKGKITLVVLLLASFGVGYALLNNVIAPAAYQHAVAQSEQIGNSQKQEKIAIANFSIPSMDCVACALNIQQKLHSMPGILKANVSFEKKSAQVVYDANKLSLPKIKQLIDKTGFEATITGVTQ